MKGMSAVYARCEVMPMRELVSTYFGPLLAIWGIFYIFVIWVLWKIVQSLRGIDESLKSADASLKEISGSLKNKS